MASLASTIMVATSATLTRRRVARERMLVGLALVHRWLSISARIAFDHAARLDGASSLSILFCWRFWNSLAERASTSVRGCQPSGTRASTPWALVSSSV